MSRSRVLTTTSAVVRSCFLVAFSAAPLACASPSQVSHEAGAQDGGSDAPLAVSVTMNANDPSGSGSNTDESILHVANVAPHKFGKLFTRGVDGDQYAQPLYMGGLKLPSGTRNVVFVATSHDSVYAFDADDPSAESPIWKRGLGTSTPLPNPWVPRPLSATDCPSAVYDLREVGITSTPVIDAATGTLYVVALDVDGAHPVPGKTCVHVDSTKPNFCRTYRCSWPTVKYELHALDLATGKDRPGSPVEVKGSVSGSGAGSVGGVLTFDTVSHLQRTSLLLANGEVYFATSSYHDYGDYHGWTFAYDAKTLVQKGVFCTTADGVEGGIWQSGRALLADGTGSVYLVTGNGTFDVNAKGNDYGDSVLMLTADLHAVKDYFSPYVSDYQGYNYLQSWDDDLGSAGATLIPGTTLLLATGKRGNGYLLDRANLGRWSPSSDEVVQKVRIAWQTNKTSCTDGVAEADVYGSPITWAGPDATHVYVWASLDAVREYALDKNGLVPSSGVCWCAPRSPVSGPDGGTVNLPADPACGVPHSKGKVSTIWGASLSVSSWGTRAGTGVLWAARATDENPHNSVVPGVLEAYDATDVGAPLWSSQAVPHDTLGNWAKFTPPTIANGKVYMPTFSNQLVVYGLL